MDGIAPSIFVGGYGQYDLASNGVNSSTGVGFQYVLGVPPITRGLPFYARVTSVTTMGVNSVATGTSWVTSYYLVVDGVDYQVNRLSYHSSASLYRPFAVPVLPLT